MGEGSVNAGADGDVPMGMNSGTIGSLFSGIGGLELGVEAVTGWRTAWQVERDPWCRNVLARHWPDAARFDDVCTVGLDAPLEPVEIVCGGFPCQPASVAGARKGMDDDRWLWPQFERVLRLVRPRLVLVENVAGLLSLDDGRAWGQVVGDLAALGYDAEWEVFRASDAGAPHRRERVFALAHAVRGPAQRHGVAGSVGGAGREDQGEGDQRQRSWHTVVGRSAAVADANRTGLQGRGTPPSVDEARRSTARTGGLGGHGDGQSLGGVGRDPHGLSRGLDAHRWPAGRGEAQHEWEPPRTIEAEPDRRPRLKALGNAVFPQVAALALSTLAARAGVVL